MREIKAFLQLAQDILKNEGNHDTTLKVVEDHHQYFIEVQSKDDLMTIPANELHQYTTMLNQQVAA